jgi:hypothetical protein
MTPDEFTGGEKKVLVGNVIENFMEDTTPEQQVALFEHLMEDGIELDSAMKENHPMLRHLLENSESVDEMLEKLENAAAASGIKYDADKVINTSLTDLGFDGYSYAGKTVSGADGYAGVSFTPEGAKKLSTAREFETGKPTPEQKANYDAERVKSMEGYEQRLGDEINARKAQRTEEMVGEVKAQESLPAEDVNSPKESAGQDYVDDPESKTAIDNSIERRRFTGNI